MFGHELDKTKVERRPTNVIVERGLTNVFVERGLPANVFVC